MVVSAVSSVVFNPINTVKNVKTEKVKETQTAEQTQPQSNSGAALRSYFMGGQGVSFGFHCSTGHFITKKIADVPCCCCGGRMILQRDVNKVAGHFAEKQGKELADEIHQNKDYFRNNQGTIAGMIAAEAEKDETVDAETAVRIISEDFSGKLRNYCSSILTQTNEIAKEQLGEENPVSKLIAAEQEKVAAGKIDRVSFTEQLVKMHEEGTINHECFDKVINSAMELPQSEKFAEKQFKRVEYRGSHAVFNELLRESTQTIEHVHPHSLGGPDDTDNYLAECGECNHQRGNMSYLKWIKVHPEYPVNAQKHIEWFQKQIVDGKIDNRYDDYGTKIKETLSKESDGRMELKVLNKEVIQELRERANAGEEINIAEELEKQEQEEKEQA